MIKEIEGKFYIVYEAEKMQGTCSYCNEVNVFFISDKQRTFDEIETCEHYYGIDMPWTLKYWSVYFRKDGSKRSRRVKLEPSK